jgi:pyruvate formate lyase activating enzyme
MSQLTGLISEIQRFSLHDGPGIRTTVFLKGCPLSCQWCHNPELIKPEREVFLNSSLCINCYDCIDSCRTGALIKEGNGIKFNRSLCNACGDCITVCPANAITGVGKQMNVGEVVEVVKRDVEFYQGFTGGATISGGEPMMQADFVEALVKQLKGEGLSVALDTSGYAPFRDYERILKYTDIILFDLKNINNARHMEFTGKSNELIKANYRRISEAGVRVFVRLPLIPGFNDDIESASLLADFVATCREPEEIDILPFNILSRSKYNDLGIKYNFEYIEQTPVDRLDEIYKLLTAKGYRVITYKK